MIAATFSGYAIALIFLVARLTCRVKIHNDPRPALRQRGMAYIYCVLHGQQLSLLMARERKTGALVSRSVDGQLVIPVFRLNGIVPFRGSKNKGGKRAIEQMKNHALKGFPNLFTVDGSKGPRGYVHKGIAELAIQANCSVLVTIAVPCRRWILTKALDRFQIPKPFTRINVYLSQPLHPQENESVQHFRQRINELLRTEELKYDPVEAKYSTQT